MQIDLSTKAPHFEQTRVENKDHGRFDHLAKSLFDQRQSFDPSFVEQLNGKLKERRVEIKGFLTA